MLDKGGVAAICADCASTMTRWKVARNPGLPTVAPLTSILHGYVDPQVSVATLLANLSSSPSPGGDSILDPADTLRDTTAVLGLLVYVPEPATAEDLATLLSLKVGAYRGLLMLLYTALGTHARGMVTPNHKHTTSARGHTTIQVLQEPCVGHKRLEI